MIAHLPLVWQPHQVVGMGLPPSHAPLHQTQLALWQWTQPSPLSSFSPPSFGLWLGWQSSVQTDGVCKQYDHSPCYVE